MIKKILYWLLSFSKIPYEAVKMFGITNDISGINKDNLPIELLPLNTTQLSRGLMNYTVFQTNLNWILPYWAEMQYDYKSFSFIPRSHLGLSMNVTHRNWTAIGNPDCDIEPIVDPRGMVTPFKNGWSIDIWFMSGEEIIFPSKHEDVKQSLYNNLPLVETKICNNGNEFGSMAYTSNHNMFINAYIKNPDSCAVIYSIRPFNPEGISLINEIRFDPSENVFIVNQKDTVKFGSSPVRVYCSSFVEGDAVRALSKNKQTYSSKCEFGLASAVAVFEAEKNDRGITCAFNLNNSGIQNSVSTPSEVADSWRKKLSHGISLVTPDQKLNSLFGFSVATLLMLYDGNTITPGPFTYHQFWIRDGAYMINALDKAGYSCYTEKILDSLKQYQDKNGYFRSQKGEWDSNGQVLWMVCQNAFLTGKENIFSENFDYLLKGLKWIERTRLLKNKFLKEPFYGLLPSGLSAEHLGLADFYFWDNFWSLSGISAFGEMCFKTGRMEEYEASLKLYNDYQKSINTSIEKVRNKFLIKEIPASCTRSIDCGMIGSVCASYPLQLFGENDESMKQTLDTIYNNFFFKGMFFQNVIHSGMNAYLTMQVAHAFLYTGDRNKFLKILDTVKDRAGSNLNYPEAIHPFTGGGVMGDGHHGWAAAEIVSAMRDAFIYERTDNSARLKELVLLAGISPEWFRKTEPFYIEKAPVCGSLISIRVIPSPDHIEIQTGTEIFKKSEGIKFLFKVPIQVKRIISGESSIPFVFNGETNFSFPILPPSIFLYL